MSKLLILLTSIAVAGAVFGAASADAPPAPAPAATTRLEISVTKRGFDPDNIHVPANKPVTLVFTRKTDSTCARSVVIKLDDGKKIEKELPLNKPIEIAVTFPKAGKLGYACAMDMAQGVIVVQ
jgi:plastocyanin domain-containing protein